MSGVMAGAGMALPRGEGMGVEVGERETGVRERGREGRREIFRS